MEEVTVIGAGVAGLSLAVHLARRGARVRVVEQEYPGYGASGRSAGIIVTLFNDDLLDLALETYRFYKGLPESEGRVGPMKALYIAGSGECVDRVLEAHRARGLGSERYEGDPGSLLGLDFRVSGEHLAVVEEYLVDTGWVMNALQQEASRLGVDIVNGEAVLSDGEYRVNGEAVEGTVVVAAGPWTSRLVPEVADSLVAYRCQMASVEGPTPRLIIEDDSMNYYLVPVSGSRFNIGDGSNQVIGDPWDGFNPDPEDGYRVLEAYAHRVEEAWESRVIQQWAAPCAIARDGLPMAGRVRDGLYVLTGFDGAGMSLAPAVAGLLASDILDGVGVPRLFSRLVREGPGVPREPYNICG